MSLLDSLYQQSVTSPKKEYPDAKKEDQEFYSLLNYLNKSLDSGGKSSTNVNVGDPGVENTAPESAQLGVYADPLPGLSPGEGKAATMLSGILYGNTPIGKAASMLGIKGATDSSIKNAVQTYLAAQAAAEAFAANLGKGAESQEASKANQMLADLFNSQIDAGNQAGGGSLSAGNYGSGLEGGSSGMQGGFVAGPGSGEY